MYSPVVSEVPIICPESSPTPPLILQGVKKWEIWRHFQHRATLKRRRFKTQQDIWILKQTHNAGWSPCVLSKFDEVRSTHPWEPFVYFGPYSEKNWCQKCAKSSTRKSGNCDDFFTLIRHVTLWPWPLTHWPWKLVVDLVSLNLIEIEQLPAELLGKPTLIDCLKVYC